MKTLKIDIGKCGYGRNCSHECEAECAARMFKSDDPAHAALCILPPGEGEVRAMLCDQCGDCAVVCPADALSRNKLGVVLLSKKLCVHCYTCVGFCEKYAFRRYPGRLEPYKCIACGICVKACPRGALAVVEVPTPEPRII